MGLCFSRSKKKEKSKNEAVSETSASSPPPPSAIPAGHSNAVTKPIGTSDVDATNEKVTVNRNVPPISGTLIQPTGAQTESITPLESSSPIVSSVISNAQANSTFVTKNETKSSEKDSQPNQDIPGIVSDNTAEMTKTDVSLEKASSIDTSKDDLKTKAHHLAQAFKDSTMHMASKAPLPSSVDNVNTSNHRDANEPIHPSFHSTLELMKKRPTSSERCIASPRESLPNQTFEDSLPSPTSPKCSSFDYTQQPYNEHATIKKEASTEPSVKASVANALNEALKVPLPSSHPVLSSTSDNASQLTSTTKVSEQAAPESLSNSLNAKIEPTAPIQVSDQKHLSQIQNEEDSTKSSDVTADETDGLSAREAHLKKLESILSKQAQFGSSPTSKIGGVPPLRPRSLDPLKESSTELAKQESHSSQPTNIIEPIEVGSLSEKPVDAHTIKSVVEAIPTRAQDNGLFAGTARSAHELHAKLPSSEPTVPAPALPAQSSPHLNGLAKENGIESKHQAELIKNDKVTAHVSSSVPEVSNDTQPAATVSSSALAHTSKAQIHTSTAKLVEEKLKEKIASTKSLEKEKVKDVTSSASPNGVIEKGEEKNMKNSALHSIEAKARDITASVNALPTESSTLLEGNLSINKEHVHNHALINANSMKAQENDLKKGSVSSLEKTGNAVLPKPHDVDPAAASKELLAATLVSTADQIAVVKKESHEKLNEVTTLSSNAINNLKTTAKSLTKSADQLLTEGKNKAETDEVLNESTTATKSTTHLSSQPASASKSSLTDSAALKSKSKSKQGLMDSLMHKLKSSKQSLPKVSDSEPTPSTLGDSTTKKGLEASSQLHADEKKVETVVHAETQKENKIAEREGEKSEEQKVNGDEKKEEKISIDEKESKNAQLLMEHVQKMISENPDLSSTSLKASTNVDGSGASHLTEPNPTFVGTAPTSSSSQSTSSISKALHTPLPSSPTASPLPSTDQTNAPPPTATATPTTTLPRSRSLTKITKASSHTSVQPVHVSPNVAQPTSKVAQSQPELTMDHFTAKNGVVSKISPPPPSTPMASAQVTESAPALSGGGPGVSPDNKKKRGSKESVRSQSSRRGNNNNRKSKNHRKSK